MLSGAALRKPPRASKCSYPMPRSPNAGARAAFLAQGARCEVGKWRTSARNSIRFAWRSARNSSNERVEWPTVQMVRPSSPERLEDIEPSWRCVVACGAGSRTLRRGVGPDDRVDEERIREGQGE